ncbi:unnamed protein product [Caenorhabditis sp. 36 PRJEB53466]|nr:unnamed protein product [Caenorhabditis sp. 36 PRJEB53466]
MTTIQPINYPVLKALLENLSIDKRDEIAYHCPGVRNSNRTVPHRIEKVFFDRVTFRINDREWVFKTHQECVSGQPDSSDSEEEDQDQWNEDPVESRENVVYPGDVVIADAPLRTNELWIARPPEPPAVLDEPVALPPLTVVNFLRRLTQPPPRPEPVYTYQVEVHYKSNLGAFVKLLPVGIKKRDVMKKLINEYLGGKAVYHVKSLAVHQQNGIVRLPERLKMEIEELSLRLNGNEILKSFAPVLERSSLPLDRMSIFLHDARDPMLQTEWLRTSKMLIIEKPGTSLAHPSLLPAILELTNTHIHLNFRNFTENDTISVIQSFLTAHRPIGSVITLVVDDCQQFLVTNLELMKQLFGAIPSTLDFEGNCPCATISMYDGAELNIFGKSSVQKSRSRLMDLWIEVMPEGSSVPRNLTNEV